MAEEREARPDGPHQNQGSLYVVENPNVRATVTDSTHHPQWNFEKFLIDKNGKVVNRWASTTTPSGIDATVEKLVAE
jgi:glutathione peroxidase-family protein